jgi:hypothetical protein
VAIAQTGVACVLGAAALFSAAVLSGEVLNLSVTQAGKEYTLRIVALLDAPQDYVYQVITDYRHAYRINPAITSVEILPADREGVTRVKNHSEHRVGLFSFEVEWMGDIVEAEGGRLEITTIPERSSFESGSAVWEILPQGDRTWVLHESTLDPKSYIVPILGDWFIKRHMKRETLAIFGRIECHAQAMLERDIREDPQRMRVALNENKECRQTLGHETIQAAKQQ